jgi:two-component system, sensor histidine kinase
LITLSYLSYQLGSVTNSLLLYLPFVLGILYIHWFGPKILPVIFINGVTTMMIWGVTKFPLKMMVLTTHEAAVALSSWLLYTQISGNKNFQPFSTTNHFLRFVLLGIVIPVCVNSAYVYHYGFINGDLDKVSLFWIADFITIFPIATCLLYFIQPTKDDGQWTIRYNKPKVSKQAYLELSLVCLTFIILSALFPFDKYWFIYGIGATFFALRWGFEIAIMLNVIIFMLSYLLPLFDFASSLLITQGSTQYFSVHLGMSTMMFVSSVVGRVVSDLSETEKNLKDEKHKAEVMNKELEQKNVELDRFVYSVSHDLSAPLKSIKGLVTISRMEPHLSPFYLDKIDKSVNRLEEFIGEVLDYSRANRNAIAYEDVEIHSLIDEINTKFEFLEGFDKITFNLNLEIATVKADRFLLRVALTNLISNAIKYQKKYSGHSPTVSISSFSCDQFQIIEIKDNGEGIKEEYQNKLFNMFYRGTASSSGSGLGLYIAKEAIERLEGKITMSSTWGEGSSFSIHLPTLK